MPQRDRTEYINNAGSKATTVEPSSEGHGSRVVTKYTSEQIEWRRQSGAARETGHAIGLGARRHDASE